MKSVTLLLLFMCHHALCQQAQWKRIDTKTNASFRSLSVVDDSVAWVGGTKGWVGRSANGGNDWVLRQVKGFENCDFRSLYAFDGKTAVIANAGAPAFVLRTDDGGDSWQVVYSDDDSLAFFDGIDFWNSRGGVIYGDPRNGKMTLLQTKDGGRSWREAPEKSRPSLQKNEASFAASGTGIRCIRQNKIVVATGGSVSGLFVSGNKGKEWRYMPTPILQGQNSTGIFSVAFIDNKNGIIVGGDYKRDTLKTDHIFYTKDGGKSWLAPRAATRGYRECVEYIDPKTAIATGPAGTDISYNGGETWAPLTDEPLLHVVRKSRKGKLVILAGGDGKILLLSPGK